MHVYILERNTIGFHYKDMLSATKSQLECVCCTAASLLTKQFASFLYTPESDMTQLTKDKKTLTSHAL
jgi:hypothetical protein